MTKKNNDTRVAAPAELREGTAEFEYFMAQSELERNSRDLGHGMRHLCNLLGYDPGQSEWLALLDEYLAKAGDDPEEILPNEKGGYYAQEAVRALIFHRRGRLADAVELLCAVVEAKPDSQYMEAWGLDWLEPAGAFESLPSNLAARSAFGALERFPEYRYLAVNRMADLDRYISLAQRYESAFGHSEASAMVHSGLLRKAGRFDEALVLIDLFLKKYPDRHLLTAKGLVYREMGDFGRALAEFDKVMEKYPDDLSVRLEIADMYFERSDWEKALEWYTTVLDREANHSWAYPSALYCGWRIKSDSLFPDEHFPEELVNMIYGDSGNRRARDIIGRFQPYTGYLPEPEDATVNVLKQLMEKDIQGQGHIITLTLSSIEAPSNQTAIALQLGDTLKVKLVVQNIPRPDPREPLGEAAYPLWRYEDADAFPVPEKPGEDVLEKLTRIAAQPYDYRRQWAEAGRMAREIGPDRTGEILAAMVHPPDLPEDITALEWLPRVQLAAAQAVAQIDDGWDGSVRQKALHSLLFGPRDWVTNAGIIAATQLAMEHEELAPKVHKAFLMLEKAIPDSGFCCYESALLYNMLMLPHLFPEERDEIQDKIIQMQNRQPQGQG